MNCIAKTDLAPLFMRLRDVMFANRERLIELDGKVGDSDLGLTMCKAFAAAFDSVSANTVDGMGRTIQLAGMAVSKAAPSTMGTLIATGFMRGGKSLDGVDSISTPEMSRFWESFLTGVMERGKAKRGDKTIVDVLAPVSDSLVTSAAKGEALESAMASAAIAAEAGLEAAKNMMAQHGKAACFREKTIGLQDAGATVAFLMIDTLKTFVLENK